MTNSVHPDQTALGLLCADAILSEILLYKMLEHLP